MMYVKKKTPRGHTSGGSSYLSASVQKCFKNGTYKKSNQAMNEISGQGKSAKKGQSCN